MTLDQKPAAGGLRVMPVVCPQHAGGDRGTVAETGHRSGDRCPGDSGVDETSPRILKAAERGMEVGRATDAGDRCHV